METDAYIPLIENIKIVKSLYKTKSSKIWLGKDISKDIYVVIKGKEKNYLLNNSNDITFLKRERAFLEQNKKSSFPHFIRSTQDSTHLFMILNFFEGTELSTLIKEKRIQQIIKNDLGLYKHMISQIVDMISYLHSSHIVYRDLKMNNIIINKSLELAMIDFGYIKNMEEDKRTSTVCGTYHIMAPEMYLKNYPGGYSFNVDIYSLGVLCYELFVGQPPHGYLFEFDKADLYFENVKLGLTADHLIKLGDNNDLKDLIKGCMEINPDDRFSIKDVKEHKFFQGDYSKYLNRSLINSDEENINKIIEEIDFNGEFVECYENKTDVFEQFF